MGGGLLNLVALGNQNILLNGNPKKTFFAATYKKHSNFGIQKFRVDYKGNRELSTTTDTIYEFKIPRHADLLYDSYIVLNLPDIYSPFYYYNAKEQDKINKQFSFFSPYNFKWIKEIGVQMIKNIEIFSGGTVLSSYDGEYLSCIAQRDYTESKKKLWDKMIGNVPELYDPANAQGRINVYPNVQYTSPNNVIEPSIRGRTLYIPIDAFFCKNSKLALPLIALQYQEISIRVTFRPIIDTYIINNVTDYSEFKDENGMTYLSKPNPNETSHQMWNFLQPPRDISASKDLYDQRLNTWNIDIHLMCNYIFLSEDERVQFSSRQHKLLIKQVYSYDFFDVMGSKIVEVESKNLVSNYMWRFRRSDAFTRNEWTNYTNWPYEDNPPQPPINLINDEYDLGGDFNNHFDWYYTGNLPKISNTDNTYPVNIKDIMINMGIIMGGVYRENVFDAGVYNYMEKYNCSIGNAKDGLYCYNFCLNNNKKEYQPTGAMNVNKFKTVNFEFNTIESPIDYSGSFVEYVCDDNNNPLGFRKNTANLNLYNFDLKIYEERYNVVIIQGGNMGLMNAR